MSIQVQTRLTQLTQSQPAATAGEYRDLVDVTELARPFFKVPVWLDRDCWHLCAAMSDADEFRQNFRIKSLLVQTKIAIKHADSRLCEWSFNIKLRRLDSICASTRRRLTASVLPGPVLVLRLSDQPCAKGGRS